LYVLVDWKTTSGTAASKKTEEIKVAPFLQNKPLDEEFFLLPPGVSMLFSLP
jgi:hypothetical protein